MAREEGMKGFFSGGTPTIIRGLAINVGMLTTYDPLKKAMTPYLGEDQMNRFVSGAIRFFFFFFFFVCLLVCSLGVYQIVGKQLKIPNVCC